MPRLLRESCRSIRHASSLWAIILFYTNALLLLNISEHIFHVLMFYLNVFSLINFHEHSSVECSYYGMGTRITGTPWLMDDVEDVNNSAGCQRDMGGTNILENSPSRKYLNKALILLYSTESSKIYIAGLKTDPLKFDLSTPVLEDAAEIQNFCLQNFPTSWALRCSIDCLIDWVAQPEVLYTCC